MKKTDINLMPSRVNPSPDYYCTWQTQLYATSGGTPAEQRDVIGEEALFGTDEPWGWAYFYENVRRDLLLVMDDSWDVPVGGDSARYGSLVLDGGKFPQSTAGAETNAEALKRLSDRVKSLGWKGVGGWVCAQEPKTGKVKCSSPEEYWEEKAMEAGASDFAYWKVDWGEKQEDLGFRRMLTEKARAKAPSLVVEHAKIPSVIPHSDVFRTYDVPALMSLPMTLTKLAGIFADRKGKGAFSAAGLINCEDEAYIAAAGGFTMGIMRHPRVGDFPSGRADRSFPDLHRRLKTKMYEVARAARWHRAAPAFGINESDASVGEDMLCDSWRFESIEDEIESWWLVESVVSSGIKDGVWTSTAPSQIARGCELASVSPNAEGMIPYIVSSRNPNGVFSIATLGRTYDREYKIPLCDVCACSGSSELVGVFGEYESLTLMTGLENIKAVLMQDMAGESALDVTDDVSISGSKVVIPGRLIHDIGCSAQPKEDTSEPGVAIKLVI